MLCHVCKETTGIESDENLFYGMWLYRRFVFRNVMMAQRCILHKEKLLMIGCVWEVNGRYP
jgi:hypothetical protein